MRLLIVGAGALGGYFGGRLMEAGQDVTFLVRHHRAAELAKTGLVIKSSHGDAEFPAPHCTLAEELRGPYDGVLVACKAYDLTKAMKCFASAVGPDTWILPLLNGIQQIEDLSRTFGKEHVLGGRCLISAALDDEGKVIHLNDMHDLTFGELDGTLTPRVQAMEATFSKAHFEAHASTHIVSQMWEKWVFIASFASTTTLLRGSIGDIVSAGATDLALRLFEECQAIGAQNGFPSRDSAKEFAHTLLTEAGSSLTSSMTKDIERGAPIEADHILGDLLRRASGSSQETSFLLKLAYTHMKTYEARRAREAALCLQTV